MRRILLLLALCAAAPACRPADAATYGRQIGAAPSSFSGAVAFNGVSTFNAEVSMPGVADFQATGVTLSVPVLAPSSSATVTHALTDTYTIDIDCTAATGADKGTVVPARAGALFVVSRWQETVVQKTGTVTTIPLFNVGSNSPTFGDWLPGTSAPIGSTAVYNQGVGAGAAVNVSQTQAAPIAGAALHAGLAQAQVGASVLVVRISLTGLWTTIP